MENIINNFWFLYAIALTGMFTHFLKKKIRGETLTAIVSYFRDHFKSTFIALVCTTIGVIYYYSELAQNSTADVIAVFAVGYMFDSMFNKFEGAANND